MKAKILVIDDDNSLRRVLEYNLQQEGYQVIAAESGEQGLLLFAEEKPSLVITDMKMSGMDGIHVLKSVKKQSPETQVIVITAFGAIDNAVEVMRLGAYDYITKPFNRDEIKHTVRNALQLVDLSEENRQLKEVLAGRLDFETMVGTSQEMEKVFEVVRRVANTDATVLVTGESGTGKELIASAIHSLSSRRSAPFIPINCAAIPRDLLESELFGHVKGAFTGAIKDKQGKFQQADGGTIFLDEVGELPLDLQPKLLRALQERTVEPVGGYKPQKLDVRVVAATNVDLEKGIKEGSFREDLFYRLSVIPIPLPALRERTKDIPLLIKYFAAKHGCGVVTFEREVLDALMRYPWPGNVRELENTVERILIMREDDTISLEDLPVKVRGEHSKGSARVVNLPDGGYPLDQLEREVVVEALERNNWNQTSAARFLRIPRHVLLYRMEKYGIVSCVKK